MTFVYIILLLTACLAISVSAENLAYTRISYTVDGIACMTDCDEYGTCRTGHKTRKQCNHGYKEAPTYYTSMSRFSHTSKCRSKCVFDGEHRSWCYVNDNFDWDVCSADLTGRGNWFQYSLKNGRCKTECGKRAGYDGNWCQTLWDGGTLWDKCNEEYFWEETAVSVYKSQKCYGNCARHEGRAYWCFVESRKKSDCAPSPVSFVCPSARRIPRSDPPYTLVSDYNAAIDNDESLLTITISSLTAPDQNTPILDYTYRDLGNGVRLPYRIRARVRPAPYNHLKGKNTRKGSDISSGARTNCNNMGMNRCLPNNNNDQCGHLIPYILGGPGEWYNLVPQTRRINVGTTTNTDLYAPSIWAQIERIMRRWVQDGGSVEYTVLVTYDLNNSTRPTGFGVIERYYDSNGALNRECNGYWYSNDPYVDPDEWNFG